MNKYANLISDLKCIRRNYSKTIIRIDRALESSIYHDCQEYVENMIEKIDITKEFIVELDKLISLYESKE
jgi:3-hydroxyacyl-CoA dehydrogenase